MGKSWVSHHNQADFAIQYFWIIYLFKLHKGVVSRGSKSASSVPAVIAAPKSEVRSGVSLAEAGSTLLRIDPMKENKTPEVN